LKQAESFQGELPPEAPEVVLDPNDLPTMQISTLKWDEAETTEGKLPRERMKALLEKRRRYIWPLLCSDFEREVSLDCETQCLAIDWYFSAGRLEMRANLSPNLTSLPAAQGETFFRTAVSRAQAMAIMPCNLRSVTADRSKETKRPRQCLARPVQLTEI